MKAPLLESIKTAEQAHQLAVDWQYKFIDNTMYMSEVVVWQHLFEKLGAKFDLTDEFRENGII